MSVSGLASDSRTYSDILSVLPRQQLVDPVDLVVGDAAEDIGEPGLRIDVVELGCLNPCVGNGGGFASLIRAHEQKNSPPEGYAPHAAFSRVVVDA